MELADILESLQAGKISVPKAQKLLSLYSIDKIQEFAKIDVGRKNRRGIPEVVFAESKQVSEITKIIKSVISKSDHILVSRMKKQDQSKIIRFAKNARFKLDIGKNSTSVLIYKKPILAKYGTVGILCAGTSDIGVAEESRLMCKAMNCKYICSYDVGVAGIHRLFPVLKDMISKDVDAIIVVAGMEGALATIVSSMVDVPVIGVPASVGYGYGKKGVAALAAMLQSCALGMSVVNIDNGIGAGAIAANICRRANTKQKSRLKPAKSSRK